MAQVVLRCFRVVQLGYQGSRGNRGNPTPLGAQCKGKSGSISRYAVTRWKLWGRSGFILSSSCGHALQCSFAAVHGSLHGCARGSSWDGSLRRAAPSVGHEVLGNAAASAKGLLEVGRGMAQDRCEFGSEGRPKVGFEIGARGSNLHDSWHSFDVGCWCCAYTPLVLYWHCTRSALVRYWLHRGTSGVQLLRLHSTIKAPVQFQCRTSVGLARDQDSTSALPVQYTCSTIKGHVTPVQYQYCTNTVGEEGEEQDEEDKNK